MNDRPRPEEPEHAAHGGARVLFVGDVPADLDALNPDARDGPAHHTGKGLFVAFAYRLIAYWSWLSCLLNALLLA